MAFHEYGANDSGDVLISLPQWVMEIGKSDQDIFFTDHEGRRNTECLSWGVDKERVLHGRTGIEVLRYCIMDKEIVTNLCSCFLFDFYLDTVAKIFSFSFAFFHSPLDR